MTIYSEKLALPFDAYCKFIREVGKTDRKMYNYLCELGFLIGSEREYKNLVSNSKCGKSDFSMRHWDRMAEKVRSNNTVAIDSYCSQLKFLSDSIVKEGVIMDMGCGDGATTEWMRRNTQAEVIGLDFSRKMVNEHKRFNGAKLVRADCEALPIKNESADQVFLNWFISNSDNNKVLGEAKRVLKPNGEVRLTTIYSMKGFCSLYANGYDDFLKTYMEKYYRDRIFQNSIDGVMDFLDCNNKVIQNEMFRVAEHGLDVSYEFSKFPLVPRGTPRIFIFNVPIAIVGKRLKS